MQKFKIIFYEKPNGYCQAKNFIFGLEPAMQAKIIGLLDVLSEKGNFLREPYSKSLGDGIFELRCQVGNNISRMLYFFFYAGTIVITNGFIKKTRKTPPREIELAKTCRKDYMERMEKP